MQNFNKKTLPKRNVQVAQSATVYLRIVWRASVNTLSSNTIFISVFDAIDLFLALLKVLNPQILDFELK